MNIENLSKLHGWLLDGAPHVVFDMGIPRATVKEFLRVGYPQHLREKVMVERDAKGLGECGSVCCIAGYATMLDPNFVPMDEHLHDDGIWGVVRDRALDILGLRNDGSFHGHPLFDQNLAPVGCTPQEAAVAVQNVLKGETAWQ